MLLLAYSAAVRKKLALPNPLIICSRAVRAGFSRCPDNLLKEGN
jgi:hypothetical protein